MRETFTPTPDPDNNINIIDSILDRLFPNSPNTKTIVRWLIRLFGYGILTYFGIDVAS